MDRRRASYGESALTLSVVVISICFLITNGKQYSVELQMSDI